MSKYCPRTDSNVTYLACDECRKDGDCICESFFLLVAGSRNFKDYDKLKSTLDRLLVNKDKVVIVSGGARGADSLARKYSIEKGFFYKEFPAQWKKYGKAAGFIRNRQMHEYIARQADRGVVLFWDGQSHGTKDNIGLAEEFCNPIRIIYF